MTIGPGWEDFYLIVGGASAALVSIQFVVVTLLASARHRPDPGTLSAFATPTVVHMGAAMVVSAAMTVPWQSVRAASTAIAGIGVAGLAYGVLVVRRAGRQKGYRPVLQDWIWYAALPCAAYVSLLVGALRLPSATHGALLVTAAAGLGLLLVGIHNAWDTVIHLLTAELGEPKE